MNKKPIEVNHDMKRYLAAQKITEYIKKTIEGTQQYGITDTWDLFKKKISAEKEITVSNPTQVSSLMKKNIETFNYKVLLKKRDSIKTEIRNINFMIDLEKRNIIKIETGKYLGHLMNGIILYFNPLTLSFSMAVFGNLKERVETNLKKAGEEYSEKHLLQCYKTALEVELQETEKHIKWLEEEIQSFEEIFNSPEKIKKEKIKTRKLAVKTH